MARRGGSAVGRRRRADWERLVAEYEQSGLTRQAFCAQASISMSSLGYWRQKLRREASGFIELPTLGGTGWDIELELGGGVVLRFRRG